MRTLRIDKGSCGPAQTHPWNGVLSPIGWALSARGRGDKVSGARGGIARTLVMSFSSPPPSKRPGPPSRAPSGAPSMAPGSPSKRPAPSLPAAPPRPTSNKPPRSVEARLDDALADAEKMARRVERVAEQDLFAAALLAREYLARTQQADVNPLEQRGRTDAWTSAFVRLRLLSDKAPDLEGFEPDGRLYIAARTEGRRLHALLGPDAMGTLAKARSVARTTRTRVAALLALAAFFALLAAAAAWAVDHAVYTHIAYAVLAVAALAALALLVRAASERVAIAKGDEHIATIERGMRERAAFESSPTGGFVMQKLHAKHPLLLRSNVSAPPSGSSR